MDQPLAPFIHDSDDNWGHSFDLLTVSGDNIFLFLVKAPRRPSLRHYSEFRCRIRLNVHRNLGVCSFWCRWKLFSRDIRTHECIHIFLIWPLPSLYFIAGVWIAGVRARWSLINMKKTSRMNFNIFEKKRFFFKCTDLLLFKFHKN